MRKKKGNKKLKGERERTEYNGQRKGCSRKKMRKTKPHEGRRTGQRKTMTRNRRQGETEEMKESMKVNEK
jgi:hypothetical protein